jgi:hypothetical protein
MLGIGFKNQGLKQSGEIKKFLFFSFFLLLLNPRDILSSDYPLDKARNFRNHHSNSTVSSKTHGFVSQLVPRTTFTA